MTRPVAAERTWNLGTWFCTFSWNMEEPLILLVLMQHKQTKRKCVLINNFSNNVIVVLDVYNEVETNMYKNYNP